jgi:hypothetical protein
MSKSVKNNRRYLTVINTFEGVGEDDWKLAVWQCTIAVTSHTHHTHITPDGDRPDPQKVCHQVRDLRVSVADTPETNSQVSTHTRTDVHIRVHIYAYA